LALRQVSSLDVGFHLEAGEHILSGRGWPGTDPFTFTLTDRPYVDTSWGFQLLVAAIHRVGGAPGLVLLRATLILLLFLTLGATGRLEGARTSALATLIVLGAVAAELRFAVRPELLSYLFLAVLLHLLHRRALGRSSPLWLLPLIQLVWVNSHGLFVLGWIAMGCFVVGLALRERRFDLPLAGWSLASLAITLLNPYGWRGVTFPFTLATRLERANVFNQSISEFASPLDLGLSEQFPFHPELPILAFRLLALLALLALVPLLRRKRFELILLLPPFLYLSLEMIRNIPLLVVAALPVLAMMGDSVERLSPRAVGPHAKRALSVLLLLVAAVLGLRAVTDAYYIDSRREERFGLGWNRLSLPVDAAEYLERAAPGERLLNHLNFGGYLMWARGEPVFIDGRLEVVGERFYRYYREALASESKLEECVGRYGIRWIVFPYKISPRLLERLSRSPRWRLAYVDHLAAVFARGGDASVPIDPGARRLLDHAPAAVSTETLPGLGGGPRLEGPRRWLLGLVHRRSFPSEPFSLGLFHYFRGEQQQAAAHFAEAVARSRGAYYEIYNNLGSALYRLRRFEEARACYRIVLEESPHNRTARQRLGLAPGPQNRRPG
jgi:tetratricopeptide (TPR) repeat protein